MSSWSLDDVVRLRAYEISRGPESGTSEENWLLAEREFAVAHDYDTADRDLERLGMILSRLPSEAGVAWRLTLPRGERVEEWEPGNDGLFPPTAITRLIGGVLSGKELVPGPPLNPDRGATRLREMLEQQRVELLANEPGARLGDDPENLHQHRVAGRRTRAFLRAARGYLDRDWRDSVSEPLAELAVATGPVRDLDVLLEYLRSCLAELDDPDRAAGETLLSRLRDERDVARRALAAAFDAESYRALLIRLRKPPQLAVDVESVPLERIARKELRRLAKTVERLGENADESAIHTLRIALKRARYAAELSLPSGRTGRRFLDAARALQDLLGEHQDAVVAERRLRAAVVVDRDTESAFLAGRLAERQHIRRARVRELLPAAWKRLHKRSGQLVSGS
jgi:CHAD domain-containing protein